MYKDNSCSEISVKIAYFKQRTIRVKMSMDPSDVITILHFNDVYNIEERDKEPVGGAPRFATALKERQHLNPLVVFSGDAFNPSIMSSLFKGKQMAAVLNSLGVHLAVYGNHDFDFGVDKIVKLSEETTFPWLLSNVYDRLTERPLAEGKLTHMLEWNGKKLGFVGLVEEDWMSTLSTVDPEDVTYLDFVEEGRRLVKELKDDGADFIIALTHMRWPNDKRLAQEVEGIDLVLGGHDHDFNDVVINGKHVLKSGTDFQYIGQVTLHFNKDGGVKVDMEKITVDKSFQPDEEVKQIVDSYSGKMSERHKKVLGRMDVDLDGRFGHVRTQETNLGNFIADIMLSATHSDVTILNAGTLRSDKVHPAGEFRIKDMMEILPFGHSVCVLEVPGDKLLEALEAGLSKYPAHEGRFPQLAGARLVFDPAKPARSRVESVQIDGQPLDHKKLYKVAMTSYIADGKDGYDVFKDCKVLIDAEQGPLMHSLIQNHFMSIRVLKGEKTLKYGHRQAIMAISRMRVLVKMREAMKAGKVNQNNDTITEPDKEPNTEPSIEPAILPTIPEKNGEAAQDKGKEENGAAGEPERKEDSPTNPPKAKLSRVAKNMAALRRFAFKRHESVDAVEKEAVTSYLAPKIEGRIIIKS